MAHKLRAGARVKFRVGGHHDRAGTVYGRVDESTIIISDEPILNLPDVLRTKSPHPYVPITNVFRLSEDFLKQHSSFRGLPPFLKLAAYEDLVHDGLRFKRGDTGLPTQANIGSDMVEIEWDKSSKKMRNGHRWTVPTDALKFCFVQPEEKDSKPVVWDHAGPITPRSFQFKKGDLAVITRSFSSVIEENGREKPVPISKGAVVRVTGESPKRRNHYTIKVIGRAHPKAVGVSAVQPVNYLDPFDGSSFFEEGEEVVISAEISFKRRSLTGERGRVIISTDEEGDVGIELPRDIKAGSLDGVGAQGRCLFIPADSLKKAE